MATIANFPAGRPFAYYGIVAGLPGSGWTAACQAVDGTGAVVTVFTVTMVEALDYSTSGDWLLSIAATAEQTAAWVASPAPFVERMLYCDVKLASGSMILPPAKFAIQAVGVCTP